MAGYKGTGMIFLKNEVKKAGPAKEEELLKLLDAEEYETWDKAMSFHWLPMSIANKLWIHCSKVLCPGQTQSRGLYTLGIKMAKHDINTVYRLIFRIISPETIMQKSAGMWRTYHQAGESHVEKKYEGMIVFYVMNYPDLPAEFCEATAGYIHGLVELAGMKNVEVAKLQKDTGWIWEIKYR